MKVTGVIVSQLDTMGQVHNGITCGRCGTSPIQGIRYRCLATGEDLCSACEKLRTPIDDDITKPLVRIQKPLGSKCILPLLPPLSPTNPKTLRGSHPSSFDFQSECL